MQKYYEIKIKSNLVQSITQDSLPLLQAFARKVEFSVKENMKGNMYIV